MFCTKCGSNLPDSAVFCVNCGTLTQIHQASAQPVQAPMPATAYTISVAPTSPPKKKNKRLIIGLAVGVPMLAIIITLAVAFLPSLLIKKVQHFR